MSFYFRFAKENDFNEEQTSAFFSIVKKTHEKAIGKSLKNNFAKTRLYQSTQN